MAYLVGSVKIVVILFRLEEITARQSKERADKVGNGKIIMSDLAPQSMLYRRI